MVLVELNETEDHDPNPSKPSSSNRATTMESAANGNRTADEGFETASDGEFADSEDDERHNHRSHQQPLQEPEQNPEQSEQQKEQIVSDDELKQKGLAQANDAKLEGNKLYGNGQFEEALSQYELALYFAPDMPSSVEIRSTCHSNRAICYLKLFSEDSDWKAKLLLKSLLGEKNKFAEICLGKYEDTIKECTKALELNPLYVKSLLRRAEAHEKLENFEEAIADMKKISELDPLNEQAKKSIHRLEPLAEQKREKMKEEMISKLKEMGNSLLGRFGMSTDNFKAVKDPNTGSYSISFQR